MPTIATELTADVPLAAMPNPEAYSYYDRTSKEAPTWSRTMTVASFVPYLAYSAIGDARILAPTPLLVVHGTRDTALLPEYAQAVYDAAGGPKRLVWVETHNHIELYDQDPYVSLAAGAVVDWLAEHLPAKGVRVRLGRRGWWQATGGGAGEAATTPGPVGLDLMRAAVPRPGAGRHLRTGGSAGAGGARRPVPGRGFRSRKSGR